MEVSKKSIKVAIHQPNFFPWLGYFDKISKCDIFVFMDDVAYPKSGSSMGTWTNRVRLLVQGQLMWINCPVIREHGIQLIKNVKINNTNRWRVKLIKTISYNYGKSLYFNEMIDWITDMIEFDSGDLATYNINNIKEICKKIGIEKTFVRQSELKIDTDNNATDLLIGIVKAVGGNEYICGGGASGYQEDEKFGTANIKLSYQNFVHPEYRQNNSKEFNPGLSIIDYLMNCGCSEYTGVVKHGND